MAYLTIAVLVLTVIFLGLHQSRNSERMLPQWLRPARRRGIDDQNDRQDSTSAQNGHATQPKLTTSDEENSEGERTPKASTATSSLEVPLFTLNEDSIEGEQARTPVSPERSVSLFPAANSSQRVRSTPLPTQPTKSDSAQKSPAGLMAPPPRPNPRLPQSSASALRVPSTGPIPNRGPPANSQQRASSGLYVNGTPATPNARNKVLLAPGHSPMDWAALTRKGSLSGVNNFQRVTPSMLRTMTGRKGKPAWSSWQGKVYNMTPYIPFHPGGEAEIMKAAGRDGTKLFLDVHPWVNWENMLGSCLVGVLVPEGRDGAGENGEEDLDDID